MKRIIFSLGLLAFVALGLTPSVQADLSVNVGTENAAASDTVFVNVSALDLDGTGSLSAYAFALDFGAAGLGLGPDLTFVGVTNSAAGNFDFFTTSPGAGVDGANYDLQINAGGLFTPALDLNGNAIELFSLEFMVGGAAAPSDFFDVQVLPFGSSAPNELFEVTGTDIGSNATASVSQGGIAVAAVPEPSSLALAVLALGGLVIRRRRS